MPPPKRDSNNSDWNENLYPQNYRAKVQSQVSPRQPLPGWPKGIRKEIPSPNKDKPDMMSESNQALNDNENFRKSEASLRARGK